MRHAPRGSAGVKAGAALLLAAAAACHAGTPPAEPAGGTMPAVLRCQVTYGGSSRLLETVAGSDPYAARPVDIDGRFLFKAVVRGSGAQVDMVRIYVYRQGELRPVLVHDARYLPPFAPGPAPAGLTGEHTVHAGPLERQLTYGCTLASAPPSAPLGPP